MTQEGLAALSGYPQQKLSELENGKRNLAISTVQRLAEALGVDMTELVKK